MIYAIMFPDYRQVLMEPTIRYFGANPNTHVRRTIYFHRPSVLPSEGEFKSM